jgi:alpha-L-rhamnosidase
MCALAQEQLSVDLSTVPITAQAGVPLRIAWRLRGTSASPPLRAQVVVANAEGATVYDSGGYACAGDDECGFSHGFPAAAVAQLAPLRAYVYRVRVANADGWSAWSARAPLLAAPGTSRADWPSGASWICSSPLATDARSTQLRAELALPAGARVASAVLSVIGLGQFRASINGARVGADDFNTPGWTAWNSTLLFSSYDVSALLRPGANALGVVLGNGMYNVPPPAQRYTKWVGSFGPRMLLLALRAELSDGTVVSFATNTSGAWTATDDGPITFTHQYAGEDFDAARDMPGWDAPGFDGFDASLRRRRIAWAAASDCSSVAPAGALVASNFPAVQVVEELPPVFVNTTLASSGSWVVDLGRNFAGFATLTVANVSAGWGLRVTPSETLRDGAIDQSSGGTPAYWDVYPNNTGETTNITLNPTFWWYGFRWLHVELVPSPVSVWRSVTPSITVTKAVYCENCDTPGDETASAGSWCDGKVDCLYEVCVCGDNTCGAGAPPCIPDPAPNQVKDFSIYWSCGDGRNFSCYIPAEADNHGLDLS